MFVYLNYHFCKEKYRSFVFKKPWVSLLIGLGDRVAPLMFS